MSANIQKQSWNENGQQNGLYYDEGMTYTWKGKPGKDPIKSIGRATEINVSDGYTNTYALNADGTVRIGADGNPIKAASTIYGGTLTDIKYDKDGNINHFRPGEGGYTETAIKYDINGIEASRVTEIKTSYNKEDIQHMMDLNTVGMLRRGRLQFSMHGERHGSK